MYTLTRIDAPTSEITPTMTERFFSFIDAKPKTIATYTRALRQFFNYLESRGIKRPTRSDVISYRAALLETHKPTTVSNYISAVKVFFSWAESESLYPNIAAHVKGAKIERNFKKDYLTAAQTKTILNGIPDSKLGIRDYALFSLMVTCGLRTVEVARANVEDLRALGSDTVLYVQGKGHDEKSDFVKVPPKVEAALRAYLMTREAITDGAPLFASTSNNSSGRRMTTRAISGIVKKHLVSSGFNSDRLTAHSLRHTAVTLSLLSGRSLDETQQFARHSNIATTQIYNHALERAKNGCSEAVSAALFD